MDICIENENMFRNFIGIIYVRCKNSFKNYFFTNFHKIKISMIFFAYQKWKKLLRIADSIKKKARCTGITAGGIKRFKQQKGHK